MLNKVQLIGFLGQDPEMRVTKDGKEVYTLSLATSLSRKQQDGTYKDYTEWHRITVFNQVKFMPFLHKGDLVYIEGYLHYTQDEQNGIKRFFTQIICNDVKKLSKTQQEQEHKENTQPPLQDDPINDSEIPF
ncbi:TPA: single-stranded DNA-binding protein [Pasteurella multocida]|nr:single-stranded DNA-binding protein [Pasteurella multocida]